MTDKTEWTEEETEQFRMQYASRDFLVRQCRDYAILLRTAKAKIEALKKLDAGRQQVWLEDTAKIQGLEFRLERAEAESSALRVERDALREALEKFTAEKWMSDEREDGVWFQSRDGDTLLFAKAAHALAASNPSAGKPCEHKRRDSVFALGMISKLTDRCLNCGEIVAKPRMGG